MADPLDLLAGDAGLDVTQPVAGADLLADPNVPGPFARGVKSGVAGVKSSLYGMGALAARGAANVLPAAAAPVVTGLEQAALENVAAQNELASQGAMSFEDVVTDPSRAGEYFKFLLGNAVPSLAAMATGGGIGAGIGAVATRGSAAALTARALGAVAPAVRTGALVGAVAPDFALEAGSIYPEALKTGVENPALRSVAGGAVAAGLDFIPLLAAEKYLKPIGKGGIGALVKGALKGAPVGAALEGTQEALQSVVERGAAGNSLTDPAAVSDYINSFLGGAAPGAVFGAGIGARRQSAAPVVEPAPTVADLGTNVPDLGTPTPADITPPTPEALHADLTAQHAAATQQVADGTTLLGTLQQAQQEGEAKIAALTAEAKLPPGERRVKAEIFAEKKDMAAQVKEVKAKIEEVGGQLNAARTTADSLAPQVEAARQALPMTGPGAVYSNPHSAQATADSLTAETGISHTVGPHPTAPERFMITPGDPAVPALTTPEITPHAAPLGSDVIADPNTPAPTEAEHIDRAVKGVHAMFREQGMPLTTTAESLATPPQTPREVALAKVEQRTPREVVPQANPAQMAAVEENAMSVIEPLAKTLAETKTKTPEGQAKVAAKMVKAMRGVVQEAARQPSIEAAQQYVTDNIPNALKGHGVTADATDMAKAVNAGVGLARTQFSKGATEGPVDYAANLAFHLQDKTGSVLGKWKGKMTADEQRKLFGRFIGKGTIIIDGTDETVMNQVKVGFGQDYDNRNVTSWKDLTPSVPPAPTSESRAALTQDEFDRLPEPAQEAATTEYNRIFRAKGTALRQNLAGIIGDRPELKVMTFSAEPGGPIGSYTRTGPLKAVITMATNAKEGLSVGDHEGYHFAEDWLLTAAERQVVANAMKAGKPLYTQLVARLQQYDRENQTSLTDEVTAIPAEARAYGFEFWRRGELKADGALARAWQKVQQFLERIVNAVKGLGFQSIEDVFIALDRGQMAEREMVAGEGGAFNSVAADQTKSAEFKRWFGGSKAADAEGKPLVVYHSGTFDENEDPIPAINGEGFHFGTKIAAEMRDTGKRVDDFIKAAVIEKGEDTQGNPAWFWSSEGIDSFDLISEDGYSTEAEAEQHMKLMATQYAEDADSEPMPVTAAYLSIKNPKRVKDQGENWADAVTKAKAEGHDGIVYRNEFEDKGKDSYIAFSPTQIKSVNNVGTFDPTNPNVLFSTAAIAKDNRMANGELEAMQLGEQYAHLIQNANPSADLLSRALGVVREDIVGGLGRWWTNTMSTPNYISAASAGFKNVYQAFNTYSRYRKILSEQLVRERLPGWYKASDADRRAAFDVMLKRTVEKYSTSSQELADLLNTLTPEQRKLYDQATGMIAGVLQRQFDSQKETRRRQLTSPGAYEKWLANRQEQMTSLLDTGYVPLRRYGDYSVSVYMEAPDGTRTQAGLEFFASPSAAKSASVAYAREIERSGVALKVELGRRSKNERGTGVSLEQFLGTLRRQGIDISQAERERLVVAMTNADSIVRTQMMRREGLAGYSTDGMRVLHEFGVNTTSEIAYARFAPVLDAALDGAEVTADVNSVTSEPIIQIGEAFGRREDGVENNLWKRDGPQSGFYKDRANAMADTTLAPDRHSEWATKLRTAGVMYFIGGSLSGAAVNTLSIPMVLVPRLSLHTDYLNASMTSLKAWKDSWQHYNVLRDMDKMKNPDAETAARLDAAGITKEMRASIVAAADHIFDTEIHMMLGISQGSLYSKSRNIQRAAEAWMAPFRVAEQTNRLASFIAAYKVATTGEGVRQPDGSFKKLSGQELFRFASETVDATQNNYNVNNRPGIMNNPVGALMFQFKSFPLFIIEAAALMYKVSPKSAVYMLLGLTAMSGVQGLPFSEEILNLVDVVSQRLFGSPFNSRRAMRNVVKSASDAIGAADLSDAVMRGMVNEITGVNIATRVSGGLLPGTRIGAADATEGRVLSELAGAPYSMVKDTLSSMGGLVSGLAGGDWKQAADALRAGGPIAVRNAVKGAEQLSQGYATDSKGRKVADVSTLDGLLQLTGLSSAAVAKMNDLDSIIIQTKAFHSQVSQDLQNQLVKAYRDGDQERIADILDLRAKWNEQNPSMPILASPAATRRAIALAGMPLNRREQILLGRRMGGAFADVTDQMAE